MSYHFIEMMRQERTDLITGIAPVMRMYQLMYPHHYNEVPEGIIYRVHLPEELGTVNSEPTSEAFPEWYAGWSLEMNTTQLDCTLHYREDRTQVSHINIYTEKALGLKITFPNNAFELYLPSLDNDLAQVNHPLLKGRPITITLQAAFYDSVRSQMKKKLQARAVSEDSLTLVDIKTLTTEPMFPPETNLD